MTAKHTFRVQINGGAENVFEAHTGEYRLAAIAGLALFDHEEHSAYDVVKIWDQSVVSAGYGPYFFGWDGQQIVGVSAERRF